MSPSGSTAHTHTHTYMHAAIGRIRGRETRAQTNRVGRPTGMLLERQKETKRGLAEGCVKRAAFVFLVTLTLPCRPSRRCCCRCHVAILRPSRPSRHLARNPTLLSQQP